jgi:CheY-like chemotaxis protein
VNRPARILVVDDNMALRVMVAQALEEHGFVTVAAESGEAALQAVADGPPDLCVVDYLMQGMNGSELIRKLRASPEPLLRRLPVIGLTAYDSGERELLSAGAMAVLRKPPDEAALVATIRRLLQPLPLGASTPA